MNPWFRRENLYKVAIFCLLISIILLIIFRIPVELRKQKQLRALQVQMEMYGEGRNWYEIYYKQKEEKERKANYVKGLEESIFYEDELYRLVERWQKESSVSNVTLIRYVPGIRSSEKEYVYQKIQMVLQGGYGSLLQFLQQVSRTTSYRNIRFSFNRATDGLQCTLDWEVLMKAGERNGKRTQITKSE